MVRLKEIIIKGFKNPKINSQILFSDNQMSIIYGANGIGKTTLLDILYAVFEKNENRLLIENVKYIQIKYVSENLEKTIEICSHLDNELSFDWSEFENSPLNDMKILYISTVRALNNYRGNFTTEALINYLKNNSTTNISINSPYFEIEDLVKYINGTSYDYISSILGKEQNIFIQGINMSDIEKLLIEHLINIESIKNRFSVELSGEIISITSKHLEQLDKKKTISCNKNINFIKEERLFLKNHIDENLCILIDRVSNFEVHSKARNSYIEQVKKIINKYREIETETDVINVFYEFTGKRVFFDKTLKVDSFGNIHSIQKLSHGEKHLLTLLTLIKYIGSKNNIILIDEPCIALDTAWQEKLLKILSEVCDKQMIIATQSPYLSIDYMNDQLEIDGGLQHV